MSVTEIDTLTFFEKVTSKSGISVIDFYAEWCGPCRNIAPKIKDLVKVYPQVSFYKVNVDEAHEISMKASISAMPTFHIYKNGILRDTIVGANLNGIITTIDELLEEDNKNF